MTMTNETNGFKVLHRDPHSGDLVSAIMRNTPGLRTIYRIGVPASNLNGPLMFFPKLKDARRFSYTFTSLGWSEIWSCTATNALPCPTVVYDASAQDAEEVRRWWHYNSWLRAVAAPSGTMAADTITLLERVDNG
jgi:hypothetical protein